MPIEDRYLGDGVYASFDGYHVVLDLRAQDGITRIALEPQVLDALNAYVADIQNAAREGTLPATKGGIGCTFCNGTGSASSAHSADGKVVDWFEKHHGTCSKCKGSGI